MIPGTAQGSGALTTDVLVIGGGNAGLVAAITAREHGARVLILESSPQEFRGGNSRHTRNVRCMYEAPTPILTETYTEEEYFADLLRVTKGRTDERLARLAVQASAALPSWLATLGVRFQPSLTGALQLSRTNAFYLGGGKALLNCEYAAAQRRGIDILYDAEVFDLDLDLELEHGCFRRARARVAGRDISVSAKTLVLAAGGFESNLEWLKEAWGESCGQLHHPRAAYNTGNILKMMLQRGAQQVGDATQAAGSASAPCSSARHFQVSSGGAPGTGAARCRMSAAASLLDGFSCHSGAKGPKGVQVGRR